MKMKIPTFSWCTKKILDLNNLGHFAPVCLFHPVRLLVFRKYATLYGYSILYLYLILKSM